MRTNIVLFGLLASAAAAQAGSIDSIATGRDETRSIETVRCDGCVKKAAKKSEAVVELAPGTQKIEIREVDGVRKVYRTEAWFGGSPVVFVSKAPVETQSLAAKDETDKTQDVVSVPSSAVAKDTAATDAKMIDATSTTSAVTADVGATVKVGAPPEAAAFDPGTLELRLD